ncbi:PadR family transcriptional regulator [Halobacillus salinarum]|uniref:PadR family transcriptional regulator n=1 Tax=Halobacillus salinarum TaxID=2932257 RepID=A0ABY4EL59_9BACI|nr:PadR family transcriptional regulator [Halobacillus salinarum]UOQ44757.1 PadR family transcriptional regulator [Halobacillus salinarum]
MYELFILGELMDKPMHGYLLQYILGKVIGPNRKMSWGVLYPLIESLKKDGCITQEFPPHTGPGRPKKILRITETGEQRFYMLMTQPMDYDQNTEDLFDVKLSNFHHIDIGEKITILEEYRGYLAFLREHLEENQTVVEQEAEIAEQEKESILLVLTHRKKRLLADVNWVEQEITKLKEANT